jgi:hypothetical protein
VVKERGGGVRSVGRNLVRRSGTKTILKRRANRAKRSRCTRTSAQDVE